MRPHAQPASARARGTLRVRLREVCKCALAQLLVGARASLRMHSLVETVRECPRGCAHKRLCVSV
eukprot:6198238-Pleurochrysis_carterae.AAC.3